MLSKDTCENVIDITDILAINEIINLLSLPKNSAQIFLNTLKSGKTLAESLRGVGIDSANQISLDVWPELRHWRNKYFPNNLKVKL